MNYINLNYANYDIKIDDIELPKEIILSLELRGKRSNNHRYDVVNKEIQVRCSRCGNWVSVFKEYQDATGGTERNGLTIPIGFPYGVKSWEQVAEVYKMCIAKRVTWEELLNYKEPPEDVLI